MLARARPSPIMAQLDSDHATTSPPMTSTKKQLVVFDFDWPVAILHSKMIEMTSTAGPWQTKTLIDGSLNSSHPTFVEK